jgi:hypothetical protein
MDENDGDPVVGVAEETSQFQAVHSRHPHIQDEASGVCEA